MLSPNSASGPNEELSLRTALLLLAAMLNMLEFFIPRIPIFPWLKPGLANCITIVWIIRYGAVDTILFTLIRIWIVGFFFGFSFLTLALALSGGIMAAAAMGIAWRLLGRRRMLGAIGIGVIGALFHNIGQLGAVYLLLARNIFLFYQAPLMFGASVIFGAITGGLAVFAAQMVEEDGATADQRLVAASRHSARSGQQTKSSKPESHGPMAKFHQPLFIDNLAIKRMRHRSDDLHRGILAAAILVFCAALAFIESLSFLAACALSISVAVLIAERGSLTAFLLPARRFWLLFLSVAALHLFFTFGKRISGIPWITHEGAQQTLIQWLRLWTWLQLAPMLTRLQFHIAFFSGLRRVFPAHGDTLSAGLLALERLPQVIGSFPGVLRSHWRTALAHPAQWLAASMRQWYAQALTISRAAAK